MPQERDQANKSVTVKGRILSHPQVLVWLLLHVFNKFSTAKTKCSGCGKCGSVL